MRKVATETAEADVCALHLPHPKIRAEDWISPLIRRLLGTTVYADGNRVMADAYRDNEMNVHESAINLHWKKRKEDFDRCNNTYQESVITEFSTLGLACVLVSVRASMEITEVTRRGEKADYWLGDREYMIEVSGQQTGDINSLCIQKSDQLLKNPFSKSGYVCVANYDKYEAMLYFYNKSDG